MAYGRNNVKIFRDWRAERDLEPGEAAIIISFVV